MVITQLKIKFKNFLKNIPQYFGVNGIKSPDFSFYKAVLSFKIFFKNNQNLLDQEKQPDWIKQKGDRAEQIKFLEQHVIFIFKQVFEVEFAKNFFGYLFEIEKEY